MSQKLYIKDGKVRNINNIVIIKDGFQTFNPTEEMLFADGWVEYIFKPTTTNSKESDINNLKEHKIREVLEYDSSEKVNIFYFQGVPIWLDKETRVGLKLRFEAELSEELIETSLWYNDNQFTLPLETAMSLLHSLEIYASKCYDNTHRHIKNIKNLSTEDDINNYNYREGYPDKLWF